MRTALSKITVVVLLLSMAVWTVPAAASFLPISKGFQDIPWGAEVAAYPQLEKVGTKNMADFYVDRSKGYVVSGIPVLRVMFGATGGKVFAVYVDLPTENALEIVRADLDTQLGPGKSKQESGETIWSWRTGKVRMKAKAAPDSQKLAIYYSPLADGVELSIFERDADTAQQDQKTWFSVETTNERPIEIPLLQF